ncbi:formate dehydrogenase accessory sulfurtransferase FdhD [Heliobacillus mobilis]|uniref:Sulfur carrier protein FdhD n=1 Tax=Heliobacterium mobile TaxID=28064 RepID=A0A6I3SF31_HELMO|nr:formate dehydrogenase accessory sulfurtransferase FdhD [Heliobacterium mobile]MTV47510.1 formate dehydrogenase accessory sulfurtransferase FdhD [Heliobacterium mobile]
MDNSSIDSRVKPLAIIRVTDAGWEERDDVLVKEWPLTIYVNGQEIVTLLTSPEHIEDLAVGFLSAEGFIQDPGQITDLRGDYSKGQVFVESTLSSIAEKTFMKRYITTGCGKGTTFYDVTDARMSRNLEENKLKVSPSQILRLMRDMQGMSQLYQQTGGVHSAALCDGEKVVIYREDIGRHNATDKIMGKCFREGISLKDKLLLTSGRISSEILLKVAKMGIAIIVSRSAPTDLAVRLGQELGMTIVGFVRGQRMNLYSHPWRVAG